MQKEELKKVTARLFKEYGFTVQGKYYYLDLDEVSIIAVIFPRYGEYVLSYNFSLKAIHSEDERKKGDPFTAYDSLLIDTINTSGSKFLNPELLSVEDLEKDIKERLFRYFDPFKKNPIKHILSHTPEVVGNVKDVIALCKDIKKHLGIMR